tara:strand:- start:38291 stop:38593 length:303 start_codon:yes stop_codon:yes gene_type:complete
MIIHLDIAIDTTRNTLKLPDGTKFCLTRAEGDAVIATTLDLARAESGHRHRAKDRGLTKSQIDQLIADWLASGNSPTVAHDSMSAEQMEEALASLLEEIA